MPKLNKNITQENDRQYKADWEKEAIFKGWLSKCPEKHRTKFDRDQAFCQWCRIPLRCHKSIIVRHASSQGHKQITTTRVCKTQKTLHTCGISKGTNESKVIDIKLALHAAIHGTISSMDHLSKVISQCDKGSPLEKLQLHRTKTSKLIQNVIAPAFLKELIQDIGEEGYSIILDESTDVSTKKFMAYCVRYFSVKHKKILTNFLGFSQVTITTAVELYSVFKNFLTNVGLKLQNLIGIGTDGAANLCGNNHSLYTLLKKDVPNLQLIKCTCHSIDKCADYATEELPSNLLFLLRETNNWFSNSGLRISMYENYYAKLNPGAEPLKFLSLSLTRWLVVYLANSIILKQWNELKGFFNMVAESPNFKKCCLARLLSEMYKDDNNYLYLVFLDTILKDLYDLNLAFQKENNDITKLYSDLRVLLVSSARRVFKPSYLRPLEISGSSQHTSTMLHQADLDAVRKALNKANDQFSNSLLPIDSVDFGYKFDKVIAERMISSNSLKTIKERAAKCIIRLCKELQERLPQNVSVIEKMKYFSPMTCLSSTGIPVKELPWDLAGENSNEDNIESQWRSLQTLRLDDISPEFDDCVDTSDFWIAVWGIKNFNGERKFKDLAAFALRALSLPVSNAGVERVFSVMAAIKTKVRNRMQMLMLVALIRIRMHLRVHGICCTTYTPSEDMLSRFNKNMYDKTSKDDEQTTLASDMELLEAFEIFNVVGDEEEGVNYQE